MQTGKFIIPLIIALMSVGDGLAIAETKFDRLTLARGFDRSAAVVTGSTGGSFSLASLANQDLNGNPCMGYGDPQPDRLLILETDFSELAIQVESKDKDVTLVIEDPNGQIIGCGFSNDNTQVAEIVGRHWQAGKYNIWVGSLEPNQRYSYRLSAR